MYSIDLRVTHVLLLSTYIVVILHTPDKGSIHKHLQDSRIAGIVAAKLIAIIPISYSTLSHLPLPTPEIRQSNHTTPRSQGTLKERKEEKQKNHFEIPSIRWSPRRRTADSSRLTLSPQHHFSLYIHTYSFVFSISIFFSFYFIFFFSPLSLSHSSLSATNKFRFKSPLDELLFVRSGPDTCLSHPVNTACRESWHLESIDLASVSIDYIPPHTPKSSSSYTVLSLLAVYLQFLSLSLSLFVSLAFRPSFPGFPCATLRMINRSPFGQDTMSLR